MRVDFAVSTGRIAQALERKLHTTVAEQADSDPQAARDGLRVSLSELGRARSMATEKNSDIDDSDLPKEIKQTLKLIRELKAQIAAKQEALKALATDQSLSPEAHRLKSEALQGELSSLSAALTGANAALLSLMRDAGLSQEQALEVGALALS